MMKNNGFTLIELVVVIVILGILAATAAPKFINLKPEAETATLEGIKAAMDGASSLVYGKAIVKGVHKLPVSDNPSVQVAGETVQLNFGHPRNVSTEWQKIIDIDESTYSYTKTIGGELVIYFKNKPKPVSILQSCLVYYITPANVGDKPIIKVNPCT